MRSRRTPCYPCIVVAWSLLFGDPDLQPNGDPDLQPNAFVTATDLSEVLANDHTKIGIFISHAAASCCERAELKEFLPGFSPAPNLDVP